jgi:hypothetical protein
VVLIQSSKHHLQFNPSASGFGFRASGAEMPGESRDFKCRCEGVLNKVAWWWHFGELSFNRSESPLQVVVVVVFIHRGQALVMAFNDFQNLTWGLIRYLFRLRVFKPIACRLGLDR